MKLNLGKILALASVALLLSACSGAAASSWPAVTQHDGNIYLSSGSNLFVVNADTGVEASIATTSGNTPARLPLNADGAVSFSAPAVFNGDDIIIGNAATKGTQLYAIDTKSGVVKWVFSEAKAPWIAGVYTNGSVVFAPSGDGDLYLLDATTGGLVSAPIKLSEHSLWATPVSDGEMIFVENMDHEVFAFDQKGVQVWKTAVDSSILGSPLVYEGKLFVGTLSGSLYSLNTADGSVNWNVKLEGNIWGTPAADGSAVYVGTVINTVGKFYSLDINSGVINWQKDEEGSIIAGAAVHEGDIYYVTEAGKLQVVTSVGTPKWQAIIENAKYYTTPVIANGLVITAPMNSDYLLAAYDLQGAQKWTFTGK